MQMYLHTDKLPYLLVGIAMLLQLADIWTTYRVFQQGGFEKAPVARWFIKRLGLLPGLVTLKVLVNAPIVAATQAGYMTWWALAAYCLVYVWVVFHNYGQIKK